jgi:uncharacterized membrane protein YccC
VITSLAPTTRLGLRAAAVALAAILVSQLPFLERSYWVIITAVLLVYETSGEGIQRALERIVTTALGCVVGFVLFYLVGSDWNLRWLVLLSGIYLAVYYRSDPTGVVYAQMVFCITVYVVFLLGIVGSWTPELVLARLVDTAVGCGVALLVSALVLPQHASKQFEQDQARFREACRDLFEKAFTALLDGGPLPTLADRQQLLQQLVKLRVRFRTSGYEDFFGQTAKRRRDRMNATEVMCRHLLAFVATVPGITTGKGISLVKESLAILASRFRAAFAVSLPNNPEPGLATTGGKESVVDLVCRRVLEQARKGELTRADFLTVSPAVYHLSEACRALEC